VMVLGKNKTGGNVMFDKHGRKGNVAKDETKSNGPETDVIVTENHESSLYTGHNDCVWHRVDKSKGRTILAFYCNEAVDKSINALKGCYSIQEGKDKLKERLQKLDNIRAEHKSSSQKTNDSVEKVQRKHALKNRLEIKKRDWFMVDLKQKYSPNIDKQILKNKVETVCLGWKFKDINMKKDKITELEKLPFYREEAAMQALNNEKKGLDEEKKVLKVELDACEFQIEQRKRILQGQVSWLFDSASDAPCAEHAGHAEEKEQAETTSQVTVEMSVQIPEQKPEEDQDHMNSPISRDASVGLVDCTIHSGTNSSTNSDSSVNSESSSTAESIGGTDSSEKSDSSEVETTGSELDSTDDDGPGESQGTTTTEQNLIPAFGSILLTASLNDKGDPKHDGLLRVHNTSNKPVYLINMAKVKANKTLEQKAIGWGRPELQFEVVTPISRLLFGGEREVSEVNQIRLQNPAERFTMEELSKMIPLNSIGSQNKPPRHFLMYGSDWWKKKHSCKVLSGLVEAPLIIRLTSGKCLASRIRIQN